MGCEDAGAYLTHVFTKGLTIGCTKDFKLHIRIRAVLRKLHHSCEASDVALPEKRKDHWHTGKNMVGVIMKEVVIKKETVS
jgi:hypothetical protein